VPCGLANDGELLRWRPGASTVTSSQNPSTSTGRPVVAVFNASQDTVDMLIAFFEQYGYEAVGEPWPAREPLDVDTVRAFVARHQPDVIVFDISFPYDHNWQRCREFHDAHDIQKIPVVLTTT